MPSPSSSRTVAASFRDPSGFLFHRDGVLYRQVNESYREHYDLLMDSGLYEALAADGLLVAHEEATVEPARPEIVYKIIRPAVVPLVSYPYEWCFSQLKDAALLTLRIQKRAFEHGMSLKDCSAYNVQFAGGRPVFIDTLSFERYEEGRPWVAYRQFCQHFLAPLALMAHRDVRLGALLRPHLDGVPLDLASALLPWRTRLSFGLLSHIHLHAKSQQRYAGKRVDLRARRLGRLAFQGLVDNLEGVVRRLRWRARGTEWADYYDETNYTDAAVEHKKRLVAEFLDETTPASVWDLGGNVGVFSRLASERGIETVCFDIDPTAVERNYLACRERGERHLLPLLLDLTNPSPSIGWANAERPALFERGAPDAVFALALVHHLAISNNVPLERIAALLHELCRVLMIEFVPKEDSQVQRLLATREDIFPDYTPGGFERAFDRHFSVDRRTPIHDSQRSIYFMRGREVSW